MKLKKATMVYKSLHGLAPEYLCSRFAIRETAYNLRDSQSYSGAILWNKLPCNVRQAESLTKFKCLLKQILWARHSWKAAFYLIFFIM